MVDSDLLMDLSSMVWEFFRIYLVQIFSISHHFLGIERSRFLFSFTLWRIEMLEMQISGGCIILCINEPLLKKKY
jgi:hypothetical protein